MPLLHSGAMLFPTFREFTYSLQTSLKPRIELAASDVDVQHFIRPVEVLEGGHQGMFGCITRELPLLPLTGWVSHILALDLQAKHGVLLQWWRLHDEDPLVVTHRQSRAISVGRLDASFPKERVPYLIPAMAGNVEIEAPWHTCCFKQDDSQSFCHVALAQAQAHHVVEVCMHILLWRNYVVPNATWRAIASEHVRNTVRLC